ncbi:MAG TPA: hypothetical protein VJC12_02355 [Candidatus Paceibacterota bacterium]
MDLNKKINSQISLGILIGILGLILILQFLVKTEEKVQASYYPVIPVANN